jgi:hypothetical protein
MMGMSPEGIVFFGYAFEEGSLEDGMPRIDEIASARALAKGVKKPDWNASPRGYGPEAEAWRQENKDTIDAWFEAKRAEEALMGADVVEWHYSGSYDYDCGFYLCVKSSRLVSEWGSMVNLSPDSMYAHHNSWEEALRNHLADLDIPLPDHCPRWFLTSLYG